MNTKSFFLLAKYPASVVIFCLTLIFLTAFSASAAAVRSGFNANSLPANDDGSTSAVPLGFSIDFFGTTYSSVYVNNNGNVTFNAALGDYTPTPFGNVGQPIIAPFWADVDTLGSGSGIVRYGTGTVNGRDAFGVNWVNVGYYNANSNKLNSFQLIIIDRSDRATGAFDVEFNYDGILWETGDASGGTNGLGGNSARAGFSDGTVNDFELPGSAVNGGFLNSNSNTGLINKSRNSTVLGRYVFEFPLQARVTKVEYEQTNGGISPIDANPNVSGGRRIFPDRDTPTDAIDRRRIRVKAQYGEGSAGVRIYFRNFDLDDPSANSAPIDDEPTTNAGDDNNGDADGTVNTRDGQLSIPSPNPNDCQTFPGGVSCLTDINGIATVDFTTTRQPGDNFTVAASANQTYLEGLTLAADGINLIDTNSVQTPVTTTTANACETSSVRACRAEMLTVWRRLHIERDSMGSVIQNYIVGTITDTRKVGTGNQTFNLSVNNLEPNRFENGRLVIQGTPAKSLNVIDATFSNGAVVTSSNSANSVTAFNNGGVFNISNGTPFILYDDDDMDNEDPNLNGDDGDNVPAPEISLMENSDTPCSNAFNANSCNVFTNAYVRPVYDIGQEDLNAFNANADNGLIQSYRNVYFQNRPTEMSEVFWTAYLLGGYQFEEPSDGDPNELGGVLGRVDSLFGMGEGAFISLERNRAAEYVSANWQTRPVALRFTTAHEIGHLFDGRHEDFNVSGDAGLMAQTGSRTSPLFTDITINKIRGGEYVDSTGTTRRITHP